MLTDDSSDGAFDNEERAHARVVIAIVSQIVPSLARAFVPGTAVLLYDFTSSATSPVTVAGGKGNARDAPASVTSAGEDTVGVRRQLPSGRIVRSSRLSFRASSGRAVAALCIDADVSDIARAQEVLAAMAPAAASPTTEARADRERFVHSVESLAQDILRETVEAVGVDVELMKKHHKIQAVRELDRRGFFALRESVDIAAQALGVTRFSIYKYFNELQESSGPPGP